jgi:nicotinate-nucleotide pyrophosphorylase (carboxylating)
LEKTLTDFSEFWQRKETQVHLGSWIQSALEEDAATRDLTAVLLKNGNESSRARAVIIAKAPGVLCGVEAVVQTFIALDPHLVIRHCAEDGSHVSAGEKVFEADSQAHLLLAGERTALNICGHLSGISTATAEMVSQAGSVSILDTRKTMPGIRRFQKHAVLVGGGVNHRFDLADFPMFKENHRALIQQEMPELKQKPDAEMSWIRQRLLEEGYTGTIAIEVEDEASMRACLNAGIEIILVDNIPPAQLREWLERAKADGLSVDSSRLEASGGIDQGSLVEHASSGVGRISVGAITHSSPILDLSMSVEAISDIDSRSRRESESPAAEDAGEAE